MPTETMKKTKKTINQRFDQAIAFLLEPGERPVAGTVAMSGAINPWLVNVLLLKKYFVEVTDRRVLFIKASKVKLRDQGLAWADPLDAVQVHDVDVRRGGWSKLVYRRPNGEDIRLRIPFDWREEGQAVVAALTSHSQQSQAPQPQAVVNGAQSPAAWHPDPLKRHEYRYWDGTRWTEQVSDAGEQSVDPTDTQAAPVP